MTQVTGYWTIIQQQQQNFVKRCRKTILVHMYFLNKNAIIFDFSYLDTRESSLGERVEHSRGCDRGSGDVLGAVFAGTTGRTSRTDMASGPCE